MEHETMWTQHWKEHIADTVTEALLIKEESACKHPRNVLGCSFNPPKPWLGEVRACPAELSWQAEHFDWWKKGALKYLFSKVPCEFLPGIHCMGAGSNIGHGLVYWGPSSCTGWVPSHGTCWCPKGGHKGVCSHHHHWCPAQWSCLVVLDPKSRCFMLLKQLLVLFPYLWVAGWWPCPAAEPHPHSPTATSKRRTQLGLGKLQFLTSTSPKKQTTKLLCLCSSWRTGRPGWVVRQSATAPRVLQTLASHLETAEMTTPKPTTHCGGGLQASCFRLLKSGNLNPLPLLFPLYIQLHIWISDHWICTEQEWEAHTEEILQDILVSIARENVPSGKSTVCSRAENATSASWASKIAELKWSLRDSWQNRDSSFSQDNFPTLFLRFTSAVCIHKHLYFLHICWLYQGLRRVRNLRKTSSMASRGNWAATAIKGSNFIVQV